MLRSQIRNTSIEKKRKKRSISKIIAINLARSIKRRKYLRKRVDTRPSKKKRQEEKKQTHKKTKDIGNKKEAISRRKEKTMILCSTNLIYFNLHFENRSAKI